MTLPGIGDYLSSIVSGADFFNTLRGVAPVLGVDDEPVFYSGNFGVVFKVCSADGVKAIKCFTRVEEGRADAYRKICLGMPPSAYIVSHRYLSDEIVAAPRGEPLSGFDVLEMDWVEGHSLAFEIDVCCKSGDGGRLALLSERFDEMAVWLLGQDFAHGDIKPDNIVVTPDGALKLVDYDGLYMPTMVGQPQRECGTVGFQHPQRATMPFGKAIDNYSLAVVSLTLRALSFEPQFYKRFTYKEELGLLFNPERAVVGSSNFISFLKGTPLGALRLTHCVQSERPDFDGLDFALRQRLTIDKEELISTLIPSRIEAKFGYADGTGMERLGAIYDSVESFSGGYAAVKRGEFWGYINERGESQTGFVYDNAWSFGDNGLAMVKYRGRYGFVDMSFSMAIGATFDYASPFSEGLAVAALDGRYGYIDQFGGWAIEPIYDYASSFHNGCAKVELCGESKIIDNCAKIIDNSDHLYPGGRFALSLH